MPVRGDRARGRRDRASARALRRGVRRRGAGPGRGARGRDARRRHDAFEGKTGYGLSRRRPRRAPCAARRASSAPTGVDRAVRPRRPAGLRPPTRGWTRSTRWRASCDVDALDIYVESVAFSQRAPRAPGRDRRARAACRCARTSSSSTPTARCRWRWPRARARSTTSRACTPTTSRRWPRAECAAVLLPGAEFLGAERVAPARALADAGAICVLATDCNPGTSPVASLPVDHRARRAPLRLERARGAAGVHAQRGVGARPVRRARLARGRQARRRRPARRARRARPLPLRPQPGVRWSSAPARWPTCARTQAWRVHA